MKNLLLDTNIYGEMVIDVTLEQIKNALSTKGDIVIFGCNLIRKELRAIPAKIKIGGSNLRIDILALYDLFIHERSLIVSSEAEELASHYQNTYRSLGGGKGETELRNDFLIVAIASLKNMDIVVSEDEATMKAELAIHAYKLVNAVKKSRIYEL